MNIQPPSQTWAFDATNPVDAPGVALPTSAVTTTSDAHHVSAPPHTVSHSPKPLVARESLHGVSAVESTVRHEIELQCPRFGPELLSHGERARCVERGILALYRWYVARSQDTRNWNPDRSFDWLAVRHDHAEAVHTVIEGFYAVEQFVPDYVHTLLQVIRASYGRSHFHIRWGAEEEKHAELWRNAVLSMGRRSPEWMEDYTDALRKRAWDLPWDDPIHMLFYTVFQERATQVNYVNLGLALSEGMPDGPFAHSADPVLAQACRTIAVDEAAHYHFFLEAARLFLYYFPEEAGAAMADVVRHFGMPARDVIPDYAAFGAVLHQSGLFSRRIHYRDVVAVALKHLGADDIRYVEAGIRRSREAPAPDGTLRTTAIFDSIDHDHVERSVRRLFERTRAFAAEAGVAHTMNLQYRQARMVMPDSRQEPMFSSRAFPGSHDL